MALLTLQPAAAAGIDNYTIESNPSNNFGTDTVIKTRTDATFRRIGLLKFDVSSIAGQTVNSATLSLWNDSTATANRDFELNSILSANSAWTEAGSVWNFELASSDRWAGDTGGDGGTDAGCSVSGTDWNAVALGTFSYTANDPAGTEHQCSLTVSQVQDWVDGNNYGFVLRLTTAAQSFDFRSSDHATAGNRPKLVIDYGVAAIQSFSRAPFWGRF